MENENEIPEGKQEIPSSGENKPFEYSVPGPRFKEKVDQVNELKEELGTIKEELETLKNQQKSKEEEKEPSTWQEVGDRAANKATETIRAEIATEKEREVKEEKAIENKFTQLQTLGETITPDVRKEVLKEMIKSGSDDVFATYLSVKEKGDKEVKGEEQKREGFIPPSRKGNDAGKTGFNYKEIRSKSLDDIINEAR